MRKLTFGVPAQERLKKPFEQALMQAGFALDAQGRKFGMLRDNFRQLPDIGYEVVRQDDMLAEISAGTIDFGVIGNDVAMEYGCDKRNTADIVTTARFGLAQCSFWFAVPAEGNADMKEIADLGGRRIATSYPELLKSILLENDVDPAAITILERSGGVERAVARGLADVAFDIVETGGSIVEDGLKPCLTSMRESFAVAVQGGGLSRQETEIANTVSARLAAVAPYRGPHYPERFAEFDKVNTLSMKRPAITPVQYAMQVA